jgi:hypothetical protein
MPPPQDPWAGQPGQPPAPRPGHGPPTPPGQPTAPPGPNHGHGSPTVPGPSGGTYPGPGHHPAYGPPGGAYPGPGPHPGYGPPGGQYPEPGPHPGYGPPGGAYPGTGQYSGYGPPTGPGQPAGSHPGYGSPTGYGPLGLPPTSMFAAPPPPAQKWKPWHKKILGVVGVLSMCLCGVALFAPDQDPTESPEPRDSPAVAALQQAATGTPEAGVTTTAKPRPSPTVSKTTPKATATKSPKAVYYADCDAAPGELGRGAAGYRKALDRDGDGVACESGGDDDPVEVEEPAEEDEGTDPRFRTCGAANDAGYGDYRRGVDPEYHWYQDRDGDGVVCET